MKPGKLKQLLIGKAQGAYLRGLEQQMIDARAAANRAILMAERPFIAAATSAFVGARGEPDATIQIVGVGGTEEKPTLTYYEGAPDPAAGG